MPDDLDALEAKAKAAMPGPWTGYVMDHIAGCSVYGPHWRLASMEWYDEPFPHDNGIEGDPRRYLGEPVPPPSHDETDATAAYIAAADPSTVLALIARVRAAEAAVIDHDDIRLVLEGFGFDDPNNEEVAASLRVRDALKEPDVDVKVEQTPEVRLWFDRGVDRGWLSKVEGHGLNPARPGDVPKLVDHCAGHNEGQWCCADHPDVWIVLHG